MDRRMLEALIAVEEMANRSVLEASLRQGRILPPITLPPEMFSEILRGAIVGAPADPEAFG